ncbi:hypothetical protein DF3PA_160035 [Candidatus Defluviicoccus seviourii]|uniref:Uncharacterized protein n=2 Tax=root TaxID=1 RepID=A0A564WCJ1_9PROT|nr:hypothetical protein DF3PB_2320001 [uncultured Defluviicoccus sp.]VUX45849.1 hypothetical protein DF3PA_160035 [Candidatus Defluviicoccus seviourii]
MAQPAQNTQACRQGKGKKNTENKWGRECALANPLTTLARDTVWAVWVPPPAPRRGFIPIFSFEARSVLRYNALPRTLVVRCRRMNPNHWLNRITRSMG